MPSNYGDSGSRDHTPSGSSNAIVSQASSGAAPQSAGPRTPSGTPPRPSSASGRAVSQGMQRIGPYLVGKTLGVGSTGRVKLGTHIETQQKVGIKIIPKETIGKENSSAISPAGSSKNAASALSPINSKLEREITIMKLIQHPNVLQLYDVYETDKELFLILEYVEGGELFDYLVKQGRLHEQEALEFFQQIMFGVDYVHRYHICHRDLKPENLLLDKNGRVKIADFGMASLQVNGKQLETSCGSPHYASPEIIKGESYHGPPADIWSCGIILFALLTGNLPFDDENIRKLLTKVKAGTYFIPHMITGDVKDLIKRMLVVDPAKRITLKEIFEHPWFNSYPTGIKPNPPMEDPAVLHLTDKTQMDPEVLESLGLLGWGKEKDLISALQEEKPNMAKAFYNLLLQRKTEFLDHWDPRDLSSWDIEGGPRRRASSYMSLGPSSQNGSRVDLNRSEMSLGNMNPEARRSTDELRKSTDDLRKSRDELRRAGEHSAGSASPGPSRRAREDVTKREDGTKAGESSSPGPSRRSSQEGPEGGRAVLKGKPNKIFTGVTKYGDTAVRVNSPLSASTHFDETRTQPPAVGASDAISQQAGPSGWTASPANSTEHSRSSSANRATSSTADKKKLTIHIPVEEEEIAPRAASSEARARKPYLSDIERRHQDEVMSRFHRARLQGPPTPVITSSPKRSWFASIFNNFKPEPLHIKSTLEYQETQTLILELLQKIGVNKVEVYKDGWKIRYDGSGSSPSSTSSSAGPSSSSSGPSSSSGLSSAGQSAVGASPSASGPSVEQGNNSPSAMKFVKFHVTIGLDPEAPVGYIVEGPFRIQFTMLQGANSTFKHLVAQLSAWWEEATYVEPEPEPEFRTFFPEDEEEPQYPFRTFFPEDEAAEEEAAAARETMMGLR